MNFMVSLKNIKIENGVAEADFYPEDSKICGHIIVDLKTDEFISCKEVEGFSHNYAWHSKYHLMELAKNGDKRTSSRTMWY